MRVPFRQLADFADFLQAKNYKQIKNYKFRNPDLNHGINTLQDQIRKL